MRLRMDRTSPARLMYRALLFAGLAGSAFGFMGHASAAPIVRGDLNNDGKINVMDAIAVMRMLVNASPATPEALIAGDMAPVPGPNGRPLGDGKLSVNDAIRILQFSIGLISLADFYANQSAVVETSSVSIRLETSRLGADLFNAPKGGEIVVPVTMTGAEEIAIAGMTFRIASLDGEPSPLIVRIEPGEMMPGGVEILTSPSDLPAEGLAAVRASFSILGSDSVSGSGEIFRLILKSPGGISAGSLYRLLLDDADFSTVDANTVQVESVEEVVTVPG